ncbi:MAG: 3-isopropylmalate dehydratase large subunit [Nitrospirae bacterium CG_4_10_14_3_um_filter_44_29]|nr:3-isopropylmalate dehydratase large subunit [Nitrospirota bacterium]PIP70715.1 MAG: 3-isopropylmalate dehydratase large subunit [Nitrospirae bacterium CG22_combo_CG10-13_8_21_14_all_44_11]PIV41710.1 MAG: 3-isopropylmalate dehydratase large subunit [Nitrospirae bacterium CG02_land_8_20_14_3_00_44_33]PIV66095.1 MAG: 3-isopropylmalate dehydratase large subunit [Nitrospirae bacterium CG01_land_8_20_14_3_00_44_22]PIX89816.1 MAG: 3-isopropylmalate dehydratase large subunit [Nitrospirae bacterium C
MTITEKILAAHAGKKKVEPGELINAKVDIILANDITAPIAIQEFKKIGAKDVFDRNRIAFIPDHFAPQKDIKAAEQCKMLKDFSREYHLGLYFEVGRMGIEHALLPEQGLVVSGDLVVGADSHTCTYGALGAFSTGVGSTDVASAMATGECWFKVPESMKFIYHGKLNKWVGGKDLILHTIGDIGVDGALYRAMEFEGEVISSLPMYGRLTMCNMAIEAGGKNGIIVPDKITRKYVRGRAKREFKFYKSDKNSKYVEIREYDCSKIPLTVSCPHLPSNTKPAAEVAHITIDQVVIGSCTNGRIEDLREAAEVIKGRKVNPNVRLIVIPATQQIYKQAMKEKLLDIFIDAEAVVSTPTCGPCLGGHMGILAKGERALATTNRNFVGRMGHPESEVYLSNPAVAAASAVLGRIGTPEELGL